MTRTHEVEVCIVGGGPAGMLLSLLLARNGVSTLVLERHEDFAREYRGEVLMPRFSRLLRQLGLESIIPALPHRQLEAGWFHWRDRRIAAIRFDRLSEEFPYALWIPQTSLLQGFADAAKRHASHELWFDATARDLLREGSRVRGVVVEKGGERIEVKSKVVVGSDGRFSSLRRMGRFEIEYERHDFDLLWFTIPEPKGDPPAFRAFFTPARAYLALPKHPASLQCGMLLPANGFSEYRVNGVESLRAHLREGPSFVRDFAETVEDFTPFTLLRANLDLVRDWEKDGLVLIGDAAHTCSPAGAIGVAIAVETAAVAAEVLLDCHRKGDWSKASLDGIQQRREPVVRDVHAIQARFGGAIGGSPFSRRITATLFPLLARTGIIERFLRPLVVGEPLALGKV